MRRANDIGRKLERRSQKSEDRRWKTEARAQCSVLSVQYPHAVILSGECVEIAKGWLSTTTGTEKIAKGKVNVAKGSGKIAKGSTQTAKGRVRPADGPLQLWVSGSSEAPKLPSHRCKRGTPLLQGGETFVLGAKVKRSVFLGVELEYATFSSLQEEGTAAGGEVVSYSSLLHDCIEWIQIKPDTANHTIQSCGSKPNLLLLVSCYLLLESYILTIKYNNSPSRKGESKIKNAHLSALQLAGEREVIKTIPNFLKSATARLYRVDINKIGCSKPHDTIVRQQGSGTIANNLKQKHAYET